MWERRYQTRDRGCGCGRDASRRNGEGFGLSNDDDEIEMKKKWCVWEFGRACNKRLAGFDWASGPVFVGLYTNLGPYLFCLA